MKIKRNQADLKVVNLRLAKQKWGQLGNRERETLSSLSSQYQLSLAFGDLLLLDSQWYVTHSGLLRLATRKSCASIRTEPVQEFCQAANARWVFKATVYKSPKSRGFVGYGDADPSNVSSLIHGAEMRMAETRAVNRALRKAYGIGLCSIEEIGSSRPANKINNQLKPVVVPNNGNGKLSLRDQLAQLIRQHRLDAALVKHYAADFCGTETLREAGREKVESFISTLAEQAANDRDSLLCQLNSYAPAQEAQQ